MLGNRLVAVFLVFPAVALLLAWSSGCDSDSMMTPTVVDGQVRGMVVEVVNRSIIELETLRIRDEADVIWTFRAAEGFIGFTPSHLKEHQLLGQSVLVTYVSQGAELVAVGLDD